MRRAAEGKWLPKTSRKVRRNNGFYLRWQSPAIRGSEKAKRGRRHRGGQRQRQGFPSSLARPENTEPAAEPEADCVELG